MALAASARRPANRPAPGGDHHRLSGGWLDFSARDHAADVPLARRPKGVTFGGSTSRSAIAAAIHAISKGERLRIGTIDPDCVAGTNEPPGSRPYWRRRMPGRRTRHLAGHQAAFGRERRNGDHHRLSWRRPDQAVSRGKVAIRTSKDPVGAPIFYRDVPLMPSELEKGVIKPLAAEAIPLVAWRVRNVGETAQPRGDGEPAGVRQLPFVLRRRQNHGHGSRWPPGQPGHVHPDAGRAARRPSASRT